MPVSPAVTAAHTQADRHFSSAFFLRERRVTESLYQNERREAAQCRARRPQCWHQYVERDSPSIHAGFSLLEVLIALLVLATCAGALLGVQLANLQGARQSAARSRAGQIVTEIADWLRMGATPAFAAFSDGPGEPAVFCDRVACTPLQMQVFEIYEWQRRSNRSLPNARLVVCRDAQPWDAAARAWRWTCETGDPGTAPVVIKLGWTERADGTMVAPLLVGTVGPLP